MAIDAIHTKSPKFKGSQFSKELIDREVLKAYIGFNFKRL